LKVLTFPTTGIATAIAVLGDPGGDIVIVGNFDGTLDFGGGTRNSASPASAFLARFDAAGRYLSDRIYDDACFSQALVDPGGNLVTSCTVSGVDFSPLIPLNLSARVDTVTRFDPAGNALWDKVVNTFASSGPPFAGLAEQAGLALDRCGNVLVSGYNVAPPAPVPAGNPDVQGGGLYVAEYDPAGTLIWSRSGLDGGNGGTAAQLAVDPQGNVFASEFPVHAVAKLDPTGSWSWAHPSTPYPLQVGVGTAGELFTLMIYGDMYCTTLLPDPGHEALGVVRYDTAGEIAWAMPLPLSADAPSAMAVDAPGTVLLAGSAMDEATLDPTGALVTEMDRDGQILWSWSPPSNGVALSFSTGFDRRGLPLVAGLVNGKAVPGDGAGIPIERGPHFMTAETIVGGSLFIAFAPGDG
jgi:hypothetical protein